VVRRLDDPAVDGTPQQPGVRVGPARPHAASGPVITVRREARCGRKRCWGRGTRAAPGPRIDAMDAEARAGSPSYHVQPCVRVAKDH
jgi:hypothetical protein